MSQWFWENSLSSAIEAAEREAHERRPERGDPPQWLVPLSANQTIKFIYEHAGPFRGREVIPMDGMMVGVGLGPVWRGILLENRTPNLPCSSTLVQMIAESSGHYLVPLLGVNSDGIYLGVELSGTQCAVPSSIGQIETVRYACRDTENYREILINALHSVNSLLSRWG